MYGLFFVLNIQINSNQPIKYIKHESIIVHLIKDSWWLYTTKHM